MKLTNNPKSRDLQGRERCVSWNKWCLWSCPSRRRSRGQQGRMLMREGCNEELANVLSLLWLKYKPRAFLVEVRSQT